MIIINDIQAINYVQLNSTEFKRYTMFNDIQIVSYNQRYSK